MIVMLLPVSFMKTSFYDATTVLSHQYSLDFSKSILLHHIVQAA